MKGRTPKKPHQKKQTVSLTGYEWREILQAIEIQLMDLNDEYEVRANTLEWIMKKIINKVDLP